MNSGKNLKTKYNTILNAIGNSAHEQELQFLIPGFLKNFMNGHKNVALYCNGYHTERILGDYVSELKEIKYIIDNNEEKASSTGYCVIPESEIKERNIDGIIISSYRYRDEIRESLLRNYPDVDYLDIYEEGEKRGIKSKEAYYSNNPYEVYMRINACVRRLEEYKDDVCTARELLVDLLRIKDLRLSLEVSLLIFELTSENEDFQIYSKIKDLKELFWEQARGIAENNVLLFCADGLRSIDFSKDNGLKRVYKEVEKRATIYTNAYAYSTSTYESLLPAFSGRADAGKESEILSAECRFVKMALEEKRKIYFYCDSYKIVEDARINYTKCSQTITQKIWDFVVDAKDITNGLFYIHELYESHYSFANPYTKDKLVARGTSIFFDYLPQNGGHLLTDYHSQHSDSIRYLDDTLVEFFENIKCTIVFFADHGNIVLKANTNLSELGDTYYTASEECIRIPLAIISSKVSPKIDSTIMSLCDINDIVITLMRNNEYTPGYRKLVKIGRNRIYNPDFHEIYNMAGKEKYLLAFTGTISNKGIKHLYFEDGTEELYDISLGDDRRIETN